MGFKDGFYRYQETSKGWIIQIKNALNLLKAAEKIRDAGIKQFDCFSPFPIHGMEKAMGLNRSWVPFFTLFFGLLGGISIFGFMFYVDVIDWPMNIGGKPYFAWPAYIPIIFEVTVLFAGISSVVAVIYLGRLNNSCRKPPTNQITSDGFAIWIGEDISKNEVEKIVGELAESIWEISPISQEKGS